MWVDEERFLWILGKWLNYPQRPSCFEIVSSRVVNNVKEQPLGEKFLSSQPVESSLSIDNVIMPERFLGMTRYCRLFTGVLESNSLTDLPNIVDEYWLIFQGLPQGGGGRSKKIRNGCNFQSLSEIEISVSHHKKVRSTAIRLAQEWVSFWCKKRLVTCSFRRDFKLDAGGYREGIIPIKM